MAATGAYAYYNIKVLNRYQTSDEQEKNLAELEKKLSQIYGLYGAREKFRSVIYPGVDHTYTPEEKVEMAAWFERWLK